MAGKSTLMRSTMAVALLSACGLYAPVADATTPYVDAFMLRTFSADAPASGQSSFKVEMVEMRCAMAFLEPPAPIWRRPFQCRVVLPVQRMQQQQGF